MTAVEGTWGTPMHSSPFFVAAVFLLMALLAVRIVEELRLRSAGRAAADGILAGLLSHAGAFVLCLGSLLGRCCFSGWPAVLSGPRRPGGTVCQSVCQSVSLSVCLSVGRHLLDKVGTGLD